MSAITDATAAAAPFDDKTRKADVTFTFKTTNENKAKAGAVALNEEVHDHLVMLSLRSARWRSFGQLVNDAIIYYLNDESQTESVNEIIETAEWDSENTKTFAITETLFDEIDLLVKHPHTEWDTKQELYTCALYCYVADNYPIVERR